MSRLEFLSKIVKRAGLLKDIFVSQTSQYQHFYHKHNCFRLIKQENWIKILKNMNTKKIYQQAGWIFFSKIVKRAGSNKCKQGGKFPQNS